MKIAIIQSGNSGFFPRFYKSLANNIERNKDKCVLIAPNSGLNKRCALPNQITWGTRLNWFIHSRWHKITGLQDIFSFFDTIHLLFLLKREKPDIIHLHVINDKILNIPLLVHHVNKHRIPIVWTMHDCRAFTGQCSYFDEMNCDKWQIGCGKCPQRETWIDNTHLQWKLRRKWNAGFKNITIVTPSQWLANFVKKSFFYKYPVQVIYNGIDTTKFSQPTLYDVHSKYKINRNKKIILGCAINWEPRKGMAFFEQLADLLPSTYQIVLLGNIKTEYLHRLSNKKIICTGRTSTFDEMVACYQAATVFCNPTLADNFPTTNIEALAAGVPIVTFRTGGSPEAIDEYTGIIVEKSDTKALYEAIMQIAENRNIYTSENCRIRSKLFSEKQYQQYIKLYHCVLQNQ